MDKVRDFKNAVRLYAYHKQQMYYLQGRLKYIHDQLGKIKSPHLGEPQGTPNHTVMDFFDEEMQLTKELYKHQYNVEWVDMMLKKMDEELKLTMLNIYLKKTHTYESMAYKFYCDERELKRKTDTKLLKIL